MFEDETRSGRISDPPDTVGRRRGRDPFCLFSLSVNTPHAYAAVSPHDGVLNSLVLPEVNCESHVDLSLDCR